MKRDSENKLIKRNNDVTLNNLRDEVIHTKNLIRDAQKTFKINEHNFKKQEEYFVKVDLKYKDICQKLGIPYTVQLLTQKEIDALTAQIEKDKIQQLQQTQSPKSQQKKQPQKTATEEMAQASPDEIQYETFVEISKQIKFF